MVSEGAGSCEWGGWGRKRKRKKEKGKEKKREGKKKGKEKKREGKKVPGVPRQATPMAFEWGDRSDMCRPQPKWVEVLPRRGGRAKKKGPK